MPRAELLASPDASGNTPLHLAAGGGNATIVKLLLATNADPGLSTAGKLDKGTTPMHTACAALARASSAEQCDAQCTVILALLNGGGLLEATDDSGRPAAAVLPQSLKHMLLERVRAVATGEGRLSMDAMDGGVSATIAVAGDADTDTLLKRLWQVGATGAFVVRD